MKPNELRSIVEDSIERGEVRTEVCDQDLSGMRIEEQDVKCTDFVNCRMVGTVFVDCDLRGASFVQSDLQGVTMVRCRVFGCELPRAIGAVQFVDCARDLYGADAPPRHGALRASLRQLLVGFASVVHMPTEKVLALAVLLAMLVMLVALAKGAL